MNTRLLLVLTILTVSGCGNSLINPDLQVISGKVNLDGIPLESGSIQFYTASPGDTPMISTTRIHKGEFRLTRRGGLLPGIYNVAIRSSGTKTKRNESGETVDPMNSDDGDAVEVIPSRYNLKTELTCEVVKNKSANVNFDLNSDTKK